MPAQRAQASSLNAERLPNRGSTRVQWLGVEALVAASGCWKGQCAQDRPLSFDAGGMRIGIAKQKDAESKETVVEQGCGVDEQRDELA